MTRWAPDARGRLERAALDLFDEQGYAATTVPQITTRAGLSKKTFFRHFADKPEVLFQSADVEAYVDALASRVSPDVPAAQLLRDLLTAVANERFKGEHDHLRRVRAIIATDPRLREREIAKRAMVSTSMRNGLSRVGFNAVAARLLADVAASSLYTAVDLWLDRSADGGQARPLSSFVIEVLDEFAVLIAVVEPARRRDQPVASSPPSASGRGAAAAASVADPQI